MKSVIFDVDGTLWDATPTASLAWRRACRQAGVPTEHITVPRIQSEFGKTMEDIALSLIPSVPRERALEIGAEAIAIEDGLLKEDPPALYPGITEIFTGLKERGIPAVIVSNCQKGYIELLIEAHGLSPYVAGHLCYGDTGEGKAYNIREAVRLFHLEDPVYVGDTAGDMEASHKAGVPFILAAYGYGDAADPDGRIGSPSDLLPLIDRELANARRHAAR